MTLKGRHSTSVGKGSEDGEGRGAGVAGGQQRDAEGSTGPGGAPPTSQQNLEIRGPPNPLGPRSAHGDQPVAGRSQEPRPAPGCTLEGQEDPGPRGCYLKETKSDPKGRCKGSD